MSSTFDPNQFLDMQFTEANDTKITPIPAGEYQAQITEVKPRTWTSKTDPTKSGLALDIIWEIDDANLKQTLGREKITVKQGIMLDITDSGAMDMGKGKNVNLGRLREALGQNVGGRPWAPSMLNGQFAKINVTQRIDGEDIYNDVKGVTKLG